MQFYMVTCYRFFWGLSLYILPKYGQIDLAYRIQSQLPQPLAAKWAIGDLAGIKSMPKATFVNKPLLQPKILREVDFVEGQMKTSNGLIYLRLDRSRPLRIQVRVPIKTNLFLPVSDLTKATVMANKARLWMGGSPQPGPAGVKIIELAQGGILVELLRGKYDF